MIKEVVRLSLLTVVPALALGCGTSPGPVDSGSQPDARAGDACTLCDDAGGDDGGPPDGGPVDGGSPDGGPPIPTDPIVVPVTTTGHDRFFGVGFDPAGNILAVGQSATAIDATADFSILVARFSPSGVLDATFGTGGIATVNVTVGGRAREIARAVVVQSSGRIVVAGAAEHDPSAAGVLANDTDIVLVGFTAAGDLDTTFGTDGIARHDLNGGVITVNMMTGADQLSAGDDQWGLALTPAGDGLVVHGRTRASGLMPDGITPRSDGDWALLGLTPDGALDPAFGGDGIVTLDIGQANASARGVTVFADGSILASGYTTSNALFPGMPTMTTQQPVLWKVLADGTPDTTFATADATTIPGVWHDFAVPSPGRAEAYGAAVQGDHLVTMGYGPTTSTTGMGTDIISLRFSLAGVPDTTYGTSGSTYVDVGGFADNGHAVVVLPDRRVLGAGIGRPTMTESDGVVVLLTESGVPDTTFGTGGMRTYDLGLNDQFWAAALSPEADRVAVVGLAGAETMTDDDDALLLVLSAVSP